jgi:integrase/recombinase XerD
MHNQNQSPGVLAPYINEYLKMRTSLGFTSEGIKYSLYAFDRFAKTKRHSSITITQELAEEWCGKRPNETPKTRSKRSSFLRQFSIYLSNLGIETYIPSTINFKRNDFTPYIFSDEELQLIFTACDSLTVYDKHGTSKLMILPVLFRMLAGTGLRIGEATALLDKDVNLEQKYLVLRNCKNGKDRIVPISDSLAEVCSQYRKYRDLLPRHCYYFLIKPNGYACPSNSFSYWWEIILKKAGIKHRGKIVGPRIHDLRHSFCVKSMAALAKNGKDLYYILPILSTYIGHGSIAATDRYVRMTSEMYPDLLSKIDSICSYIFPNVKNR